MLIAQITDCHIVEPGELLDGRTDTAAMLRAAVVHLNALTPRPDVVLATGDLTNDGRPAQYELLAEILAALEPPLLTIPGNHDERVNLRASLPTGLDSQPPSIDTASIDTASIGTASIGTASIDYVCDEWPLRLVGLDTSMPGRHDGELTSAQLDWLEITLTQAPDRPTLLFQHHPPFQTGIAWMDAVGLTGREAQEEVLAGHRQVVGVVCGHLHRVIQKPFAGTIASTWPSTGAQVALALDGSANQYCNEPPAVALHLWSEQTGLVSHLSYVDGAEPWLPSWAVQHASG